MDSSQWQQGIEGLRSVQTAPAAAQKNPRPPKEQALNCPRCTSTNTKFCYYNNYSLSQPRYFCKNCRRYWTEGGSLRNVPVGGGSRKNKRSSSLSSASSSKRLAQDINSQPSFLPTNPRIQQGHDLNLNPFLPEFPFVSKSNLLPSLDLAFTSGQSRILMPDYSNVYSSLHLKSSLGFSVDGLNPNVYGGNPSSRVLFPFDGSKPVSIVNQFGRDEANGLMKCWMEAHGDW